MSFEIGDEVFGTDPEQRETFGQMCRVLRAGGGTVDLIVYDPETRMWEDRDMSIAGVLATSFSIAHSKNDYDPLEEGVSDVLNNKDPFAAIEVLMCRHRLQARMYPNEKAVADCTFISREELIRQSAECLVRLAAASMAPYNEEVVMSKKKDGAAVAPTWDGPENKPDVGAHHGAQQSNPKPAKAVDFTRHVLLPENFQNRSQDWCRGFVERQLAGTSIKGKAEEEALAKVATEGDDYIDGWNKATNYIRSGGK
jgi:hypothetical protein